MSGFFFFFQNKQKRMAEPNTFAVLQWSPLKGSELVSKATRQNPNLYFFFVWIGMSDR